MKNGFYVMSAKAQAAQLEWFAAEIAKPTSSPFTIVMGHHPIFSNGKHGDHAVLIKEWEPLLRKHKAHLYSPATTTTCSTSSSKSTPHPSSARAQAARTSTTSKFRRTLAAPTRTRSSASRISKSRRRKSPSATSTATPGWSTRSPKAPTTLFPMLT